LMLFWELPPLLSAAFFILLPFFSQVEIVDYLLIWIFLNVQFWRIGRSLQSKLPSPRHVLLCHSTLPSKNIFPGARRMPYYLFSSHVAASSSLFAPPANTLPLRSFCPLLPNYDAMMSSLALPAYTAI
jgi:hypothetical protein